MDDIIKDKIAKISQLVQKGATEGERQAAKNALDRLMNKYNLDDSVLSSLEFKEYVFKYTKAIELQLLQQIMGIMVPHAIERSAISPWNKRVVSNLQYMDWITLECAYEYFRKHMRKEWNRIVLPELAKCKKNKTRNKRRAKLGELFFMKYCIASKLYEGELTTVAVKGRKNLADRLALTSVEGGQYNKQVVGGLLLAIESKIKPDQCPHCVSPKNLQS